jgi:phage terminase small subunit
MTTPRHLKFVREYIKDGNAAQAAVRAGYGKKGARKQGCRLLGRPDIRRAVEAERAPALAGWKLTVEDHIAKLSALRDKAERAEQYGAAIKAEELRGKVGGFYVERHAMVGDLPVLRIVRE